MDWDLILHELNAVQDTMLCYLRTVL